jgi:hemerythrin
LTGGNLVEWNTKYSVGIKLIDEQHKKLIEMTNTLYKGCLGGEEAARTYFMETIQEAVDYVKYHFSTEEKLMAKVNYPSLADHRKQHESFVLKILMDVKNFRDGQKFVPILFVRFLNDWVLSHIAVMDKQYAKYILQLKKEGSLQDIIHSK